MDRRVWSKEEDEAIRRLVAEFGTRSWSVIAEHIAADQGKSAAAAAASIDRRRDGMVCMHGIC